MPGQGQIKKSQDTVLARGGIMKKRFWAVLMTALLLVTLISPLGDYASYAADLNANVDDNAKVIRDSAVSAYMRGDTGFIVYHTQFRLTAAPHGVTASNMESVRQEIYNALNYLGRINPEMSTPILDRIELPGPGSGQTTFYFTLRKDPSVGEMTIGQALAKEYLSKNSNPSYRTGFNDNYNLLDEINKYSESAYAALQVKAYEFFLSYAKKCTDSIMYVPTDYLVKQNVTIPFSDILNTFFDEPAFTQLFFEYQNLADAESFRDDILKEIYETLWYLCHNSAFWLDNGACNNSSHVKYTGVPYEVVSHNSLKITFTVSAVKETVYYGTKSNENTAEVVNGVYYDPLGFTHKNVDGNSFKSIAEMATEFDTRLQKLISQFYIENLSDIANEYAAYRFLRGYLNYGNLENDNILSEKISAPSTHIPYDVWYKAEGKLMHNYAYAYTAVMNGNGICDGQVKAAQSILMYLGIKSTVGMYSDGGGHVWNYVYFNGQKYILDVGPHRSYPIFNIGYSFACNNKQSDKEYTDYATLGNAFSALDDFYGSTADAYLTTIQDGEYVYYIDFTDNCNVYKVKLDGTGGKPVKVYSAPGNNSLTSIKNYLLTNDGSTHEKVYDNVLLAEWNTRFYTNSPSNYGTIEREMKSKTHTITEAWNYRSTAGLYYANLTKNGSDIMLNLKYKSNTGKIKDHHFILNYKEPYRAATAGSTSAYVGTGQITYTNKYYAGGLILSGTINGTVSAASNDALERTVVTHNGVKLWDKYHSYPQGVGLGTLVYSPACMTYGENSRTVLGKTKPFNAVNVRAYTKKKLKSSIDGRCVNMILKLSDCEYSITNVSATAAGNYTVNFQSYNYNTSKTTKYAFSWTGAKPAKAGAINTMCRFNKETNTLMFVLENGEIREFCLNSNGTAFDCNNIHCYQAGTVNLFSTSDWNEYAALVAKGYCRDFKVYLQKDLDFKRGSISPIGIASSSFCGVFDGNGYSVNSGTVSATGDYAGLFGSVDKGSITHFTASNITVNGKRFAGIVGYLYYGSISYVRVTDCSIKGTDYVGTVGHACKSTLSNIFLTDRMSFSGNTYVGGVLGRSDLKVEITKCFNGADISGASCIGGILGGSPTVGSASNDTKITCCFNTGSINATKSLGGGIAGDFGHTTMWRNYSFGKVKVAGR